MNDMANLDISHLKRLSTIRSGKNIKFLTPAVYSGGWCPMRVACNIVEDIKGVSYVLIGMPECGVYSRGMSALPEGPGGELRRIYVLDANEVVFGCKRGVVEALKTMDAEGAKAILMIATCVTDLIGEDFEGIINEAQPELNARLSFVTLGQFCNFGSPMGTWKTAEALGAFMTRREKDGNRANALFIEPWRNKKDPVKFPLVVGALRNMGVDIRPIAAGADLGDYMNAPDAALNLTLSSYMQPLAARMENTFGVPYAPLHRAFSVADIDGVYEGISSAFGLCGADRPDGSQSSQGSHGSRSSRDGCFGEIFSAWRDRAVGLEARAARELRGLRYAILPGVDMPAAVALYLAGFGMEPLIIHIEDFHREDAGYAADLKALGYDPPVCRMMNIDHDIGIIGRMKPDICFGNLPDPPAPIEGLRSSEEMGDFFGVTGYERTVGILSRIFTVLETGETGERMDLYGPVPL